jgi:hypothetical protein
MTITSQSNDNGSCFYFTGRKVSGVLEASGTSELEYVYHNTYWMSRRRGFTGGVCWSSYRSSSSSQGTSPFAQNIQESGYYSYTRV